MTTPLRAPPARILHARYRASSAALLARPDGPVEAVDLASGEAVTLRCLERTWLPVDRLREPELIGLPLHVPVPLRPRRRAGPRPQLVAVAAALAAGVVLTAFARGTIDRGGSAARALERRATPSAEAAPRLRSVRPAVPPERVRGGPALAVASPPGHATRSAIARPPAVVAPPRLRIPARAPPAPPPDLPPPVPAVDALPLPD